MLKTVGADGTWRLANDYPTYPLTAPGMPFPGADFIYRAEQLGDSDIQLVGKKIDKRLSTEHAYLRALYALALYNSNFEIDVQVKQERKPVRFIPGHRWIYDDTPTGPVNRCKVMVIGKMPGKDEACEGRNLAGIPGDLLASVMAQAGCDYAGWYVTNIVKFPHPCPWQGSAISKQWIQDCKPLLEQELRFVRPDYILCLGTDAGKAMLGLQGSVSNSAGKVFDYKIDLRKTYEDEPEFHNAKLMVALHPSAVARTPDLMPQLEEAALQFAKLVAGQDVGAEETDLEHIVVRTEEELAKITAQILEETKNGGAIAIDGEWEGQHAGEPKSWLRTIQISHKPKFAVCIVLRNIGGSVGFDSDDTIPLKYLRQIFACSTDRHIRAVGHFHRADLPWLKDYGLDLTEQFAAPDSWQLTTTRGGFDTGAAAHSINETDEFKLEIQAARYTTATRYDITLQKWKKAYCLANKIKEEDLTGYGNVPDEILFPYACLDADVTRRLFDVYNGVDGNPGLLDADTYGNNSREAFWISMRASPACAEIEATGLLIDTERVAQLTNLYRAAKIDKIKQLRELVGWPTFKPSSPFDCRELLFGSELRGQVDKVTGKAKRIAPATATIFNLVPVKSTSKTTRMTWADIRRMKLEYQFTASTDKEVLGILAHLNPSLPAISLLRDIKFVSQLLNTTLRPPVVDKNGEDVLDVDGNKIYVKGLSSYLCSDNRVRTTIYQTMETGRYSSARPNLQAISKRREADYKRILGKAYTLPLRSIFIAPPGYVLLEADYVGAELAVTAWMSQDPVMMERVRRSQLPEDHVDFFDMHASVAVEAFKLNCAPTKTGLKSIGAEQLRVAAKNVQFGVLYGRGAAAIQKQCQEEGVDITVAQAQALVDGIFELYPLMREYFISSRTRVHSPGWMCNSFGRFRRFRNNEITNADRKVIGELERQAMNFTIQSCVADAVSRALDHLHMRVGFEHLHYKIALQIHDAVLLQVPIAEIEETYDKVIPRCMTDLVDVWPTSQDGFVLPGTTAQHLATDKEVMISWGVKLTKQECQKLGIPERFGKD